MFERRWLPTLRRRVSDDPEAGQAMVEFVIVFPVQLILTTFLMQLAFLIIGRTAVDHAAWCAARAALVSCQAGGEDPEQEAERAAEQFLIPVAGRKGGIGFPINYPGWGPMDRSTASKTKTRVEVLNANNLRTADRVTVKIEHDYLLAVPIANGLWTIPGGHHVYFSSSGSYDKNYQKTLLYGAPHMVLGATRWIPKPWKDPDN